MNVNGLMRRADVLEKVSFGKSTLFRYINCPVKKFPAPIKLSVWHKSEVLEWIANQ